MLVLNGQQDFKMRFKELLEYKRDITISNFGDRLISRMHNDTTLRDWITTRQPEDSQLHDMFFDEVEQADPSQNKQYVQWIVQRFLDKSIVRYEDISSSIAEFLFKYHELKTRNRLNDPSDGAQSIPNDINQIKTKDGINAVHTEMTPRWNRMNVELKDRQEQKVLSKGKSTEVYQDEQVRVIVPEDEDAACYYGQGTQWCTASTIGQNYFNHYNNNGKLYILIPKKPEHEGEKYQLHFGTDFYANENDSGVPLKKLINRWPQLHKVFHEEYTNAWNDSDDMKGTVFLATPETLDNWEDITHDEILPRIKPHLETPVSVYNWIGLARLENHYQAYIAYIDNDNDDDDDEYTAFNDMITNALDEITEFISKNKEKSLGVIDGIILDLTEINTAMKYNDISGTISHHIYKMMPDAESSAMHKDQPRVLRDLRFKVNEQIWTAISRSLNPYFEDVFDGV